MITRVLKRGNGLAIQIPSSIARRAGISAGSTVSISMDGVDIIVRSARPARYRIEELVSRITPGSIHHEIPLSSRVGNESW